MVLECLQCWWNGRSPVPVFFDAADLDRHKRASHSLTVYDVQERLAAPWIAVGFTYQASFTETGNLLLAYPWLPSESQVGATHEPVLQAMSLASAASQSTLW